MPTEDEVRAMQEGRAPVPRAQAESIDEAVPSSLGYGVQGSGPVDETERRNTEYAAPGAGTKGPENPNVEAEQLETFAEGKVADAVDRKSGTQLAEGETVTDQSFTDDLERKKREQASAREAIKEQRGSGVDVDGGLGSRRAAGTEDNRDV
ncbi:hypothetical protein HYQ46_011113 [Verticillium longisporum]|nr:hypothetical protein HYQ46_011113 [Verticillium longisporum]